VKIVETQQALLDSMVEIRGDGKAGGGLVLTFQSLAALLLSDPELHVQEWPFFSSARRGANIRSFMRVGRRPIATACEVNHPTISLLMNEAAAQTVDFAEGMAPGGIYIINSRRSPEECATHFKLSGRVLTISGDDIGLEHLKHPIGNVSAYVALAGAIGGFDDEAVTNAFLKTLEKRRVPKLLLDRNRKALEASRGAVRVGEFDEAGPDDHRLTPFNGYGELPIGAQTALRLADANPTAGYARSGRRLRFADPEDACTGCSHCITNCPEGIIRFLPDAERGLKVTGVDISTYCKLCRECIAVCPEKLFTEVAFEEQWKEVTVTP